MIKTFYELVGKFPSPTLEYILWEVPRRLVTWYVHPYASCEYFYMYGLPTTVGSVAQSVLRLATGWTVWGSNPGGGEIFRTCPDRSSGRPSLLYNGYQVFPVVKSGGCVTLTPHSLLVPWSRKSRAIPLLALWAVRPVQSHSACTTVHLYLYLYLYFPYRP